MSNYRDEVEEELHKAQGPDRWRDLRLIELGVRLGLDAARRAADDAELGKEYDDFGREHFSAGRTILNCVRAINAVDPESVLENS